MPSINFRPYEVGDPPRVLRWYKADRKGFESFMGMDLPDELSCTLSMNTLLGAASEGYAVFLMITYDDDTIGFAGLTNITPDRRCGQPHIYIAPDHRRHSIRVAKAAEQFAADHGVKQVMITIENDNRRGLALAKRLRYYEVPRKTFLKELSA
jgi:GNAT superfamily N-acetyltransferase